MDLKSNDTIEMVPEESYFEFLNDEFAATKIGGIIFIGTLMVIGVVGNLHVLYIYAFRFKRSTHRIYILCLAIVDTVTCCVGMPFVIIDLRHTLMSSDVAVCKILRFMNYFTSSSSAILLVVIAVDRYKNICHPFEIQMTEKRAKLACLISVIVATCLSWPAAVLYGYSTVTPEMISSYLKIEAKVNITGSQCFTEDRYFKTPYQAIYNITLIGIVIVLTLILAILYGLICKAVISQTRKFAKLTKTKNSNLNDDKGTDGTRFYIEMYPEVFEGNSSSVGSSGTQTESLNGDQSNKETVKDGQAIGMEMRYTETKNHNSESKIALGDDFKRNRQENGSSPWLREHYVSSNNNSETVSKMDDDAVSACAVNKINTDTNADVTKDISEIGCCHGKKLPIFNLNGCCNVEGETEAVSSRTENEANICKCELYKKNNETRKYENIREGTSGSSEMVNINSSNKREIGNFTDAQLKSSCDKNVSKTEDNPIIKREKQARRITLMLFIITLVFVLSFIPHLGLKTIALIRKDFINNLSYTALTLYNTFVWSFFINNMANPIIYGFYDAMFRQEVLKLYNFRSNCNLSKR